MLRYFSFGEGSAHSRQFKDHFDSTPEKRFRLKPKNYTSINPSAKEAV